MKRMSAKSKIYIILGCWLLVSVVMFSYVFKNFEAGNRLTKDKVDQQNKELALLEAEKASYEQAKNDLSELGQKTLQPDDFFSKDITLVNELKTLENLAKNLGLELNLSGLSGTTQNASKAKTQGDIVVIPYSMNAIGPFAKVVDFMETTENLPFITYLTGVSLTASPNGLINASFTANFFLRK